MFDADKDLRMMRVYGNIGSYFDNGISDVDVMKALDMFGGDDIDIYMKSDGGDVFEGISIYNQLKKYPGKVKVTVDSIAASISSVIAMGADELVMDGEHSMLMIHNPWTAAVGDAKEFRSVAELLDKIGGEIASIYAKKSKKDKEYFLNVMKEDKYYTASEALAEGLVDSISGYEDTEEMEVYEEVIFAAAKYDHIDFTPPESVRNEAAKGLEWRAEYNRGGTEVGVARARDLKNGKSISPSTAKRMKSFFARHEVDKQADGFSAGEDGYPSAGRIAWALWGGDAGQSWSNKLVKQIDAADAKKAKAATLASFAKRRDAQDRLNRAKLS
jgi:ATP-dependent protease ClpP protease subunit